MKTLLRIWRNYRVGRAEGRERADALRNAIYLGTKKPLIRADHPSKGGNYDYTRCECGHFMGDHRPDEHGTLCISCQAMSRHRPVNEELKAWPEVIA